MTLSDKAKSNRMRTSRTNSAPIPGRLRDFEPKVTSRRKAEVRRPRKRVPRAGSKTRKLLALLQRPQGAGIKELLKVTGWQPHSVRGFISGVVVRKMGLPVTSTKAESGERRYAIRPRVPHKTGL